MKRRDVIEQQIKLLLTGYRSSDFTNEHMVSVFMGNLDTHGVFRADVDKLAKPDPQAAPPRPTKVPDRYYLRVDEDDGSYTCLYCAECEEDIDGFDEPTLYRVVDVAMQHEADNHS